MMMMIIILNDDDKYANMMQVTGEPRMEIVDDTPLLINIKAST